MIVLLSIMVMFLCIILFLQYRAKQEKDQHLRYMAEKLEGIMMDSTREQIQIVTDDKQVVHLMMQINQLLDRSREHERNFIHTEASMKRMLANISHDLKTPLTVIVGYLEMLENQSNLPASEQAQLLRKVRKKANELVHLMNTFFDLAKLESGDQVIELERVNLTEIAKQNLLAFYELIETKGFEVDIQLPDRPIWMRGNEEALNRIFNNLISNALKYGADGNWFGLHLCEDKQFITIQIIDRGKGLDEIQQERVFERMYTLEESRNKAFQGSGLGLTITKRLVEAMDGVIQVASKPYKETNFTIQWKR